MESADIAPAAAPQPKGLALKWARMAARGERYRMNIRQSVVMCGRLAKYLKPYRGRWVAGLVLGGLYGAWVGVLIPALGKSLEFLESSNREMPLWQLIAAASLLPAYFLIRAILAYLNVYCLMWVGLRVLFDLRTDLFAHLQRLSIDYFFKERSGMILQRIMQRTKMIQQALVGTVSDIVKQPLAILGTTAVLLYKDPTFTLLAMAFIPLSILPALIMGYVIRNKGRQEEELEGTTMSILQENLLGARVVKSYAREDEEVKRFRDAARREYGMAIRSRRLLELTSPTVEVMGSLGFAAAIVYGVHTDMEVKKLVQLVAGLFLLYDPFKRLSKIYVHIQRIGASLERLFELQDTKPAITDAPGAIAISGAQGRFELRDVVFLYNKRDERPKKLKITPLPGDEEETDEEEAELERRERVRPERALDRVSHTFQPGKYYALVGPSGAGKSSIFMLLLRLYDPNHGAVFLDGNDLRSITTGSLREQIGLVSQEVFLFHDTIYNNILYGRPKASAESVRTAAKRAFADEFIERLPEGYDSVVGDKGCRLSGGQAQRVSLARAFLKNAPILLLDEATSALDAESAAKVQEAIDRFCVGRTVIAIAHRLATVQRADEILLMEKGRVTATGRHEELLASSPQYRRMCELQFG